MRLRGSILACAVVSVTATALLKDYTNQDISEEYEDLTDQPGR
jgi:hypothetical protein